MPGRSRRVFISRPAGVSETVARDVRAHLEKFDYRVFLDNERQEDVRLGSIRRKIRAFQHFLVVLTPAISVDLRLHLEIHHAFKHDRNVIPIFAEGFNSHDLEDFPADIAQLENTQGLNVDETTFEYAMEDLLKLLDQPPGAFEVLVQRFRAQLTNWLRSTFAFLVQATSLILLGCGVLGQLLAVLVGQLSARTRRAAMSGTEAMLRATSLIKPILVALGLFGLFFAGALVSNESPPVSGVAPAGASPLTVDLDPREYAGRPAGEVTGDLHRQGFSTDVRSATGITIDESNCEVDRIDPNGEVPRWANVVVTCR